MRMRKEELEQRKAVKRKEATFDNPKKSASAMLARTRRNKHVWNAAMVSRRTRAGRGAYYDSGPCADVMWHEAKREICSRCAHSHNGKHALTKLHTTHKIAYSTATTLTCTRVTTSTCPPGRASVCTSARVPARTKRNEHPYWSVRALARARLCASTCSWASSRGCVRACTRAYLSGRARVCVKVCTTKCAASVRTLRKRACAYAYVSVRVRECQQQEGANQRRKSRARRVHTKRTARTKQTNGALDMQIEKLCTTGAHACTTVGAAVRACCLGGFMRLKPDLEQERPGMTSTFKCEKKSGYASRARGNVPQE
eukprot:2643720-Pleurochrysis_carterae.AAC.1